MVQNHDQPNSQKFSTSEETAYPPLLAYTIAFCIAQELINLGWNPPGIEFAEPESISFQYLRAVVGTQPKASKLPPLLSEYSHVLCLQVPPDGLPVQYGQQLQHALQHVPPGSRLLRRPPLRLNGGKKGSKKGSGDKPCGDKLCDDNLNWPAGPFKSPEKPCPGKPSSEHTHALQDQPVAYFGVYRTGLQFVDAAVKAGHPVGRSAKLPGPLHEAVQCVATVPIGELAKRRHAVLAYWLERARSRVGMNPPFTQVCRVIATNPCAKKITPLERDATVLRVSGL